MPFNVNLNSNATKRTDYLKPKNMIKQTLASGGRIDLEPKGVVKRFVEVNDNSLYSYKNEKIKFTNFAFPNKKQNNPNLQINLSNLISDISFICDKVEEVIFKENTKKLETILDHYYPIWREGSDIFKVDGESTKLNGRNSNPFRVYLEVKFIPRESTSYRILFCDIHHLAIISGHNGKPAHIVEQETFLSTKYCACHIYQLLEGI